MYFRSCLRYSGSIVVLVGDVRLEVVGSRWGPGTVPSTVHTALYITQDQPLQKPSSIFLNVCDTQETPCRASSRHQHEPYDVQELQNPYCTVRIRICTALQYSDTPRCFKLKQETDTDNGIAAQLQKPSKLARNRRSPSSATAFHSGVHYE